MMKELFKNTILFIIFGAIYCGVEIIWRGYTDISMAIVGGIAGVFIGCLNERFFKEATIPEQCLIGGTFITLLEGCSGYILNYKLGFHIWDYSGMPGQFFFGQCCVPYCIAWVFLSGIAVFLDDWLRYLLFDESPKKYRWIRKCSQKT